MNFLEKTEGNQLYAITWSLLDTSSDEEYPRRKHGDGLPGKAAKMNREPHMLYDLLYRQYLGIGPTYNHEIFWRRFHNSQAIFNQLF